jgi:pimeloyl-ACP methyl ester carboxylesterase
MSKIETTSFGPLKQIDAGVLNVAYAEAGPADGRAVIVVHGWPYDIHSYVDVAPLLAVEGYRVIVPYLRGYGTTRFLSDETFRNGQQSALAVDTIALMDALEIDTAVLAGFDWGARTADIIAAVWPERCKALVAVSGYLIGSQVAGKAPLPPEAELQWWYQFYFSTERGRAGYDKYRRDFAKLIWRTASPKWDFDDATFDRSAASLDNPDHVAITIHNYRWRLGLAEGEANYDGLEKRLAEGPVIPVPTITLEGDANGAPHPEPSPMPRSSQAGIRTGRSRAASDTTFPRKLRRASPKLSSRSIPTNQGALNVRSNLEHRPSHRRSRPRRLRRRLQLDRRDRAAAGERNPGDGGREPAARHLGGQRLRRERVCADPGSRPCGRALLRGRGDLERGDRREQRRGVGVRRGLRAGRG